MEYSKLGKELEIYTNVDYIGKGFPIILPNGAKMMKILQEMVEDEEEKRGYYIVRTPSCSRAFIARESGSVVNASSMCADSILFL